MSRDNPKVSYLSDVLICIYAESSCCRDEKLLTVANVCYVLTIH